MTKFVESNENNTSQKKLDNATRRMGIDWSSSSMMSSLDYTRFEHNNTTRMTPYKVIIFIPPDQWSC